MTPQHKILPLIIRLFFGAFAGLALVGVLGVAIEPLCNFIGLDVERYGLAMAVFVWLLWPICVAMFVVPEWKRQRTAYRIATNRCETCGYSLRGIREESKQCPECGKAFKVIIGRTPL